MRKGKLLRITLVTAVIMLMLAAAKQIAFASEISVTFESNIQSESSRRFRASCAMP